MNGILTMRPPAMCLLALVLLPPLLGGCGAAIQIAVQAATEMTVRSVHYAIVSGSRENAIRNYADVGFKAERPDAIRPAEDAAVWLRANRETFEQQVAAYNEAHDLARGPGDSGGERVTNVHAVDWILLSDARLDKLSAVTEFRVGTRDFVTANKTFVLQWQGEGLAIVDHLNGTEATLAAYLGLPPSPPDPIAVAKGGKSSPDAITPAPARAGRGPPRGRATRPGSPASAGPTATEPATPAPDLPAAQAEFDAWLEGNREHLLEEIGDYARKTDLQDVNVQGGSIQSLQQLTVVRRDGDDWVVDITYYLYRTAPGGSHQTKNHTDRFRLTIRDGQLANIALAGQTPTAVAPPPVDPAQARAEFDTWLAANKTEFLAELTRVGQAKGFSLLERGQEKIIGVMLKRVEGRGEGRYLVDLDYEIADAGGWNYRSTQASARVLVTLSEGKLLAIEPS